MASIEEILVRPSVSLMCGVPPAMGAHVDRNGSARRARQARILVYSHDTYGLGHLRRSLLLTEALLQTPEVGAVLVASGSPRAGSFSLPAACDVVKLPAVTKTPVGRYRARSLGLPIAEVARIRAELVRAAAASFHPDLVLVDHAPLGMLGELLPTLRWLGSRAAGTRLVLGLRDVIDEPHRVEEEWSRLGAWDVLRSAYDRILVYGDPDVGTTAKDLDLERRLPGLVVHVGYLGRPIPRAPSSADPMVLVTVGGGGDGHELLRRYAAFLEGLAPGAGFRSVVVTGPLMAPRRRRELAARFGSLAHPVELLTFTDRFEELLGRTSALVSMAGYNSVVEALSAKVPTLLVPREWPRLEQRIRAERLAERVPQVAWTPAAACTPEGIADFVLRAVQGPTPRAGAPALDGVARATGEVVALLASSPRREGETLRVPA